jgi:hypothetical protein
MDETRDGFFSRLSPEGRRSAPVIYRCAHTSPIRTATIMRVVESKPYHAAGYVCSGFRKPISKCLGEDEP